MLYSLLVQEALILLQGQLIWTPLHQIIKHDLKAIDSALVLHWLTSYSYGFDYNASQV